MAGSRGPREKTKALMERLHEVAKHSGMAMVDYLEKLTSKEMEIGFEKGQIHPMVLNAILGTSVDKIAKYENWERKGVGEAGDWVKTLVAGLQQVGGGRISLEVETLPEPIEVKTIDAPYVSGLLEGRKDERERRANPDAFKEAQRRRKAESRARLKAKAIDAEVVLTDSTLPQ